MFISTIVMVEFIDGTPDLEPESVALFAAMDVQPDDTRKALINDTIVALKNAGLWDPHDVIHIRWAHTEQASNLNWKDPTGPFNSAGVNAPVFTPNVGVAGNGTTSYVNLNWAPTNGINYQQDSATFWIWDNTPDTSTPSVAGTGTAIDVLINPRSTASSQIVYRINNTTATNAAGALADGSGLTAVSRSGATATLAYKNGAQQGITGTVASLALSPSVLNLGRTNTSSFSAHQFGADGVASNLTAQQHADLFSIISAYRTGALPF